MKTYHLKPTWAGHGVSATHGFSNGTYGYNASYPEWQAGYSSNRFHATAWEFDTSAVQAAIDRGAKVTEMYFDLQMSRLQDYTSWSLAYKARHQTDGLNGTFTKLKKNQEETYSSYGDYLALVRNGSQYGCSVVKEGTSATSVDWVNRIPIPVSSTQQYQGVPLYGLTLSSYNSSTTSRKYNIYESLETAELVIVTDEVELTLTYNANGGSGAPSEQKTYGDPITISAVTPSWIGHSFQGWATTPTATQETYRPGGTITISQDTTLYAVWKLITYDVTYNANGGTGAPARQVKTYGVPLQLTEDVPAWTGHTFQGWATSASGDVAYMPGDTYSVNASQALYAVWKLDQYTVSYHANGGTGAPAAQKKNYNATITLSQTVPVYPGYEFVKWNTDPYGLGTDYQGGQSYSANHDLDLYAIWTPAGVRVNFNANGGACDTDYLTLYPGQPYGELPQAIYPGHTFDGWFTAPVDGDQVLPTTIVETGEEHTLFAHWTAAPSPGRHAGEIYCKRNGRMLHGVLYTKKDGVMLRGQFYTM